MILNVELQKGSKLKPGMIVVEKKEVDEIIENENQTWTIKYIDHPDEIVSDDEYFLIKE